VEEFPARLARTHRFTAGVPHALSWHGDSLRFLRDGGLFEADGETERLLADRVESYDGPAFVRDGSLWTVGGGLRATGPVGRVRSAPGGGLIAYAVNDALRILDHDVEPGPAGRDFSWSPDGTRLLVTLVDDSGVPRRAGVPYPVAGEPNPGSRWPWSGSTARGGSTGSADTSYGPGGTGTGRTRWS
jgi:hypothetical protein